MFGFQNARRNVPTLLRLIVRGIHRNHYDALELTPKASQADIKKAYYKLSMKYHPDKNKGNDKQFREITSAYEVLGNIKLRRLYDKGLLPAGASSVDDVDSATMDEMDRQSVRDKAFYQRTEGKSKVPQSGRTSVYDYDAWSRAHYSQTFSRREEDKFRFEKEQKLKATRSAQTGAEGVLLLLGIIIFLLGGMGSRMLSSYDTPSKSKETKDR